jgi:hypothetical protein
MLKRCGQLGLCVVQAAVCGQQRPPRQARQAGSRRPQALLDTHDCCLSVEARHAHYLLMPCVVCIGIVSAGLEGRGMGTAVSCRSSFQEQEQLEQPEQLQEPEHMQEGQQLLVGLLKQVSILLLVRAGCSAGRERPVVLCCCTAHAQLQWAGPASSSVPTCLTCRIMHDCQPGAAVAVLFAELWREGGKLGSSAWGSPGAANCLLTC